MITRMTIVTLTMIVKLMITRVSVAILMIVMTVTLTRRSIVVNSKPLPMIIMITIIFTLTMMLKVEEG